MHPCCNDSRQTRRQTRTKVVAIVQLVCAIPIITFGIFGVAAGRVLTSQELNENMDSTSADSDDAKNAGAGTAVIRVSAFLLVAGIVSVLMSILLYYGAYKRNRKICMIWFVLTAISLVCSLLSTLNSSGEPRLVGNVVGFFFMWVVWAFITELKDEAASPPNANIN